MKKKRLKAFFKEMYFRFRDDDVPALAAQLAYYLILAFFPFLLFLITLLSLTPLTESQAIASISKFLPGDIFNIAFKIIKEARAVNKGTVLSFSVLVTIWASSSGTSAAITAINKAYDQEESRSFLKIQLLSVMFTIALAVVLMTAFILLVLVEVVGRNLLNSIGLAGAFSFLGIVIRYALPAVIMFFVFIVIYFYIPNKRIRPGDAVPGAIFSTAGWIIIAAGFSLYVRYFGNLTSIYGGIGGIVLLLIWLYWSSIIILLGGELNAALTYTREGIKRKKGKKYC